MIVGVAVAVVIGIIGLAVAGHHRRIDTTSTAYYDGHFQALDYAQIYFAISGSTISIDDGQSECQQMSSSPAYSGEQVSTGHNGEDFMAGCIAGIKDFQRKYPPR